MFKKAKKENLKLRLALAGSAGSGKTMSALSIASGLLKNPAIALIDTENSSASRYADIFDFDVCVLDDYNPARYISAIKYAEQANYDVIIIDSLTHAWYWELEATDGNFKNWSKVRPLERKLIDAMLQSTAHIIVTMRSKTEYVMEEYTSNGKTKSAPKKVGLAPIQSAGIEYEFDLAGELNNEHILSISKSRFPALSNKTFLEPGKEFASLILKSLQSNEESQINFQSNKPESQLKAEPKPKPINQHREELMELTDIELSRLGWGAVKGSKFLVEQFKVNSRHKLTDDNLSLFLEMLQQLEPELEKDVSSVMEVAEQPEPFPSVEGIKETQHRKQPIDFKEWLAVSDAQLARLCWSPDQGKDYLLETFGKRSRQLLTDDELIKFCQSLMQLPTPTVEV